MKHVDTLYQSNGKNYDLEKDFPFLLYKTIKQSCCTKKWRKKIEFLPNSGRNNTQLPVNIKELLLKFPYCRHYAENGLYVLPLALNGRELFLVGVIRQET